MRMNNGKKSVRLLEILTLCMILGGCGGSVRKETEDGILHIENGMAQPILKYSDISTDNQDSEILRFCVYVETDHDTDGDGMADLVKAFVQLPKSAAEGKYKAAAIYDPTPYAAGTVTGVETAFQLPYETEPFDMTKLYEPGKKREPAGSTDTLTAALAADSSQWIYTVPGSDTKGYFHSGNYDYFLVRGFAVIDACGIGTYGSEGFELCGTDLERDSHKAVVEWLAGNRRAFTDRTSNMEITADWCNHRIAMTGKSYGGTLPFEVATTGVEGLKTIIPVAGISNWYNYSNSQGVSITAFPHYTDFLSSYNAGASFLDDAWLVPDPAYSAWKYQERNDELQANGNYTKTWAARDYSRSFDRIRCSALIVEGLNDFNVTPTHSTEMYESFKKAGQNVKMILHQDGHNYLFGKMVGEILYEELVNQWLCHYLYETDNGIESFPEISVQSNLDGSYSFHDSFNDLPLVSFQPETADEKTVIHSGSFPDFVNTMKTVKREDYYRTFDHDHLAVYDLPVKEGTVISGTPEVHVRLSTEDTDQDNLMVTALLMDTAENGSAFQVFDLIDQNHTLIPHKTTGSYEIGEGHEKGSLTELVPSYTRGKMLTIGHMDLLDPEAEKSPTADTSWHTAEAGVYRDYRIVLFPTEYTLNKGHVLQLYLFAQDPWRSRNDDEKPDEYTDDKVDEVYSFQIDSSSVKVLLPIRE